MFLDPFPIGLYLKGKSLGKANFEVFAYKKKSHGRRRVEREIKKLVCVTNQVNDFPPETLCSRRRDKRHF